MSTIVLDIPDPIVKATAKNNHPEFTAEVLKGIQERADKLEDQVVKTDMFKLIQRIKTLEALNGTRP